MRWEIEGAVPTIIILEGQTVELKIELRSLVIELVVLCVQIKTVSGIVVFKLIPRMVLKNFLQSMLAEELEEVWKGDV